MGFTAKGKSDNWGMGFLLVFFPEDEKAIATSSPPPSFNPLRRTPSSHLIITRAQSTISVCALLLFLSLLLLTLSPSPTQNYHTAPRRLLLSSPEITILPSHALQKLGVLHRRGTRGMHDLIVCHVAESVGSQDLRLFLRLFHVSGLGSKSDLAFIFQNSENNFEGIISEENNYFLKSNITRSIKLSKKEREIGEPIWGRRSKSNFSSNSDDVAQLATESTRPGYGSVVSFVADELDPENSLSGFLDHIPMSMRRWACYPMLLGRVRRNFKHVALVDLGEIFLLGDPLGRVKTHTPEYVYISTDHHNNKRKNSNSERVNPGLITGGSRGVRRLANVVLTEIVRMSTNQRKKKGLITESGILNQLIGNEFILKSASVVLSTESVPDVSSLVRVNSSSGLVKLPAVRRGNNNSNVNVNYVRKHICSLVGHSNSVYSDC